MKPKLIEIYHILLDEFGEQEWWPMKKTFRPKEFEVATGAILTQNTSWNNVEKSLEKMEQENLTDAKKVGKTNIKKLESAVKSSGFYKQKAKKLKEMAKHSSNKDFYKNIIREKLIDIKGIGKETADTILLYACDRLYFVIDSYTRRVFTRLGLIYEKMKYDQIREFFEKNLPNDVYIYKEFHALIVELAKKYCKKNKPLCDECPLKDVCRYYYNLH